MHTDMEHVTAHNSNGSGHEHREVDVRLILASLFALLIGAFLVCLLTVGIFQFFHNTYQPDRAASLPAVVPPEPRVEDKPFQQLQNLHAFEDHVLTSYAVTDKKQGTVRVPIDRAIDMLAQKGLPSHDYLSDILSGRKSPAAPAEPKKAQGSNNAK
ncbi:MAG TPA: hypothetical protein VEV17_03400 [Bryobacteraceae bacterium]|nr:hypothetical protein [Bryobacteraceae bacterium]